MQTHTIAIFENSKVEHVEAVVEYETRTEGGPIEISHIVGEGDTIPEALHSLADQLEKRMAIDSALSSHDGNGTDEDEDLN